MEMVWTMYHKYNKPLSWCNSLINMGDMMQKWDIKEIKNNKLIRRNK